MDGASKKQMESLEGEVEGEILGERGGVKCPHIPESRRPYACSGLNTRSEETQEDPKFSFPADPQALNMQEVKTMAKL